MQLAHCVASLAIVLALVVGKVSADPGAAWTADKYRNSTIKDLRKLQHFGIADGDAKIVWQYSCAKALKNIKDGLAFANHYKTSHTDRANQPAAGYGLAVCNVNHQLGGDNGIASEDITLPVAKKLGWGIDDDWN
ncbi:hypothetical protein IE81DRAFT_350084 [Ceraceosorus guamensis]|uniref:SCP domain-containing protein n=1 Tax=Ceraceosorus guamensis TaxID=1522189 RepID=A0A316VT08_9BASI|nr:hypothetical protein IE81DRAFT_350084 [Ceraceosorus guamensis]PWN39543.1 hypothetical protein IE81DRAFT_350084 [Ceraceosorus guamensis]